MGFGGEHCYLFKVLFPKFKEIFPFSLWLSITHNYIVNYILANINETLKKNYYLIPPKFRVSLVLRFLSGKVFITRKNEISSQLIFRHSKQNQKFNQYLKQSINYLLEPFFLFFNLNLFILIRG